MTRNRIVVLPLVEEEDTKESGHRTGGKNLYEKWIEQYAETILPRKVGDRPLKITPQLFGHNGEKENWTTTVQYNLKAMMYAAELPFNVSTVRMTNNKGEADWKASYVTIYRVEAFKEEDFGPTLRRGAAVTRPRLKAWIEKEFPGTYAKFAKDAGKEPAIDPSAVTDAEFKDIKNEKPAEGELESGVH